MSEKAVLPAASAPPIVSSQPGPSNYGAITSGTAIPGAIPPQTPPSYGEATSTYPNSGQSNVTTATSQYHGVYPILQVMPAVAGDSSITSLQTAAMPTNYGGSPVTGAAPIQYPYPTAGSGTTTQQYPGYPTGGAAVIQQPPPGIAVGSGYPVATHRTTVVVQQPRDVTQDAAADIETSDVLTLTAAAAIAEELAEPDRKWDNGLCSCCSTCCLCCCSCFCPCFMIGRNAMKLGHTCCCCYCVGSAIPGVQCVLQRRLRTELREQRRIEGSVCGDCCASWFCWSCALTQEGNELKRMTDSVENSD